MAEYQKENTEKLDSNEEDIIDAATDYFKALNDFAMRIVNIRKRSLLVMYYPLGSQISEIDIEQIFDELQDNLHNEKHKEVDLLLHTMGGSPDAAYLITQIIHDFFDEIVAIVPNHAMSAGTLICLGTNEIKLGAHATLSPIDISLVASNPDDPIHLVNLDFYLKFVRHFKKTMLLDELETHADENLMSKLVEYINPLDIGHFFRLRELTLFYAKVLLEDYMFADLKYKEGDVKMISDKLVFELPSHDFLIDYHIAIKIGLRVSELDVELSYLCKEIVEMLDECVERYVCWYLGNGQRLPYFKLYTYKEKKNNGN